ncbi:MAG: OmpA family protein [Methylophilaceae bacterium]
MNKKLMSLAIAATLGLSAFAASADDMYRGAWYAVPGVSYMNTDSDLEADNGGGGFISIGKELSQSWDLQGRLGYNRADEDLGLGIGESGKYKQTTLGLDALYMFSRDKFRPFLLAGLGVARNNVDYKVPGVDIDGKKTSWLAGLGLGAQYLFNDHFGLQADLRHQWSRAEVSTSGLVNDDKTETIGNTLLNLGGIFRFGAPAPVVAEAAPEPAPVAAAPEPAPEPAPAPEPVKCTPKMETITVGAEKLFGFDKANLKDEGKAALDEAAAKIKANPEISVVIVTGHTDRIGSEAYNQKLSERRANQVKDYLVEQGVNSSIIEAVGKGESEPVVECAGNKATKKLVSCLQPNRRVTIQAEGKKESGCN